MRYLNVVAYFLLSIISPRGVASTCVMTDTTCEFRLSIEQHLTMMDGSAAVYPQNGKLYRYDVTNISAATPVDIENVIQADGNEAQRLVTLANGTMPGPAIEVYEGQTVIIHVTNHLFNEGVTIHWHGLHMRNTPYMDGVGLITQCPIHPHQTFTYKFKADPKGTFWYHSHLGNQRTMGLFGPLIIHEKKPKEMEEFIISLQDWNQDDSTTVHLKMNFGGFENRVEMNTTKSYDDSRFSRFFMKSGLINGRGRLYDAAGNSNYAPLTVFNVKQNQMYRFRVIGAGHLYPFRVSVDSHELTVVASDGYDLKPQTAESFVINPGERVDFIINTNNMVNNYWIRAQTLEVGVDHKAEAILRYEGAPEADPTTSRRICTPDNACVVVNCPFTIFPVPNTECLRFDQLQSLVDNDPAPSIKPGAFEEHFLNFAFPGTEHYPGQVNGHKFVMPAVNALGQMSEVTTTCDKANCGPDRTCECTFMLDLKYNDTVQLVMVNMGNGKWWNHPMHLHGHSFYVLKMGYARQNMSNGKIIGDNLDIDCGGTDKNWCNSPTWSNRAWSGDNIPGLELAKPPRKDTIIVPTGGYVVIRIRADNPGLWFFHCHIEMHNKDGMAMLINEAPSHHPKPPKDFPKCSEFGPEVVYPEEPEPESTTMSTTQKSAEQNTLTPKQSTVDQEIFWIVVGCLLGVCLLEFNIIFCLCCWRFDWFRREKKYRTPARESPLHIPRVNGGFEQESPRQTGDVNKDLERFHHM